MQTLTRPREDARGRVPQSGADVLPRSRRRRVPLAIVAALVAVCSALLFTLLYRSADDRKLVLVVAHDVPAGRVVNASDLVVRKVGADAAVSLVPVADRSSVIGKPAAVDLVAGELLSRRQIGAVRGLDPSEVVVSLSLPDGETPSLSPGDEVEVVRAQPGTRNDAPDAATVMGVARVVEVRRDANGKVSVSVALPRDLAADVAAASAANHVRLVRVGRP